ncbi:MAG: hypothetical protein ACHRXM_10360 [Isosphaerales bacterium]
MCSHLTGLLRAVAALGAISFVSASHADELRLESATLPAPLWEGGKVNVVIEASGVEPIGDGRRLLIAHDKAPALFVVDAASGRIMGAPITSPRFPQLNGVGPKWEGMARDADGNYYLIGAHNGKTDQERATKSVLIRFRIKDGDLPSIDDASIVRWDVARSLEAVLKAEGLAAEQVAKRKVEGLAVRELKAAGGSVRRELLIGLREPDDKVRVFAADISTSPSSDAELELKPAFAFVAEPREGVTSQLTSLEYVPALGGFLVVTASEDGANAFHGNILWFVADGETGRARKVATFEVAMKAEGLAILGVEKTAERTAVRLLITYDNDPHATKIPSRFQTATLIRESR